MFFPVSWAAPATGPASPPAGAAGEEVTKKAEPVAICRLKRVAADNKDDVKSRMPSLPAQTNGKRVALIGAGPASLTVARESSAAGL